MIKVLNGSSAELTDGQDTSAHGRMKVAFTDEGVVAPVLGHRSGSGSTRSQPGAAIRAVAGVRAGCSKGEVRSAVVRPLMRHHPEVTQAAPDLAAEMRAHMVDPFPSSVQRGSEYGDVDAVMIGADVYGWALSVQLGAVLTSHQRARLQQAADDLARALPAFPHEARPYYGRVLRIARLALDRR